VSSFDPWRFARFERAPMVIAPQWRCGLAFLARRSGPQLSGFASDSSTSFRPIRVRAASDGGPAGRSSPPTPLPGKGFGSWRSGP